MVILISSSQNELINAQLEKLKKTNLSEINEFTYSFYDRNFIEFENIIEDLETVSFYDRRMVVVKNFDNKDYDSLKKYIDKEDNDDVTLVLIFNAIDKKSQLYNLIKNKGKVIEISDVDKKDMARVIKKLFENHEVSIYDDALNEFISRVDFDLTLIKNEIFKLKALDKKITLEDVENLVSKKLDDNIFDILDGIINENYNKSLKTYHGLLKNGYKSVAIIPVIASSLRFIYQVKELYSEGYSNDEIAQTLKCHPYRVKINLKNSYNYSKKDILKLLDELFQLDYNIKSGKVNMDQGLELFILRREGN